jgi:hypothetical protein
MSTQTWTFNTSQLPGTYYWTNKGTTDADDFVDGTNSGSFTVTAGTPYNVGVITKTLKVDKKTEGQEDIIVEIRKDSITGVVLATAVPVFVADTSIRSITLTITRADTGPATVLIANTATLNFTLTDPSSDFGADDVTVTAGSITNFSGSGTAYTATYVPPTLSMGTSTIVVNQGTFSDSSGLANLQSNILNINYQTYNEISLGVQTVLALPINGGNNGQATALVTNGSGQYTVTWTLESTGAVLGTGMNLTGLSNFTDYRVTAVDNITGSTDHIVFQLGDNSFYYAFDWLVVRYQFTDGQDLDTRTRPTSPVDSVTAMGWGQLGRFPASGPAVWQWGGDNLGQGFESVLLDLNAFRTAYPGVTSLRATLSCAWFNTRGNNPIVIGCSLYQGGTPSLSSYLWSVNNPTNQFNVDSVAIPCTQGPPLGKSNPGQAMAKFRYDLTTTLGTFQIQLTPV